MSPTPCQTLAKDTSRGTWVVGSASPCRVQEIPLNMINMQDLPGDVGIAVQSNQTPPELHHRTTCQYHFLTTTKLSI